MEFKKICIAGVSYGIYIEQNIFINIHIGEEENMLEDEIQKLNSVTHVNFRDNKLLNELNDKDSINHNNIMFIIIFFYLYIHILTQRMFISFGTMPLNNNRKR